MDITDTNVNVIPPATPNQDLLFVGAILTRSAKAFICTLEVLVVDVVKAFSESL